MRSGGSPGPSQPESKARPYFLRGFALAPREEMPRIDFGDGALIDTLEDILGRHTGGEDPHMLLGVDLRAGTTSVLQDDLSRRGNRSTVVLVTACRWSVLRARAPSLSPWSLSTGNCDANSLKVQRPRASPFI